MEQIKVIQFLYGLDDGGVETLVKDYATLIDAQKFDLMIVIIRKYRDTANRRLVEAANIPVIAIYPCWNVFTKLWQVTMGRWYVPYKLRRILRDNQTQVLHTHMALLKYVKRIGKELQGVRLFYTCHSLPKRYLGKKEVPAEYDAAKYLLENHELQFAALHQDMANELNDLFGIDNTVVIRNGIDFNRFRNLPISKQEKRCELQIPANAFVLGHVGRFVEYKNQIFLIDVLNEVLKIKNNAFLLMIGSGNMSSVEERINELGLKEHCMILTHRTDVNEILRAMDVFLFPSKFEGLGIALIEAQVSGLKCVAADTVPREAFKTEKAIALPLGEPKRWAEVILDENVKGSPQGNLDDYDMNKEIRRLEKLYLGELNE